MCVERMWLRIDQQRWFGARSESVRECSSEHGNEQQLGHGAMLRRQGKERLKLLCGVERRHGFRGFDLRGFRFDQAHDVRDHVGILHMVIGDA